MECLSLEAELAVPWDRGVAGLAGEWGDPGVIGLVHSQQLRTPLRPVR